MSKKWMRGWQHSSPNVEGAPSTGYRSTTTGLPHPSVPRPAARSRVPRGQRHGPERRIDRLVNPDLNQGLPAFLAAHPGVSSGFMIAHVAAVSLLNECKV